MTLYQTVLWWSPWRRTSPWADKMLLYGLTVLPKLPVSVRLTQPQNHEDHNTNCGKLSQICSRSPDSKSHVLQTTTYGLLQAATKDKDRNEPCSDKTGLKPNCSDKTGLTDYFNILMYNITQYYKTYIYML